MANILVVDDDPQVLQFMRTVLERDGHSVDSTSDGKSAKEMYEAHPYDLLVTDVVLPGKEGLDLILELQRSHPAMKVIAVSGGDIIEPGYYLELATILGAQHALAKPFTPAEFLGKIRQVLHGQGPATPGGYSEVLRN